MVRKNLVFTVQGGRLIVRTTVGGTNFSESDVEHREIVPAGKRWLVLSTVLKADVSATRVISVFNAADVSMGFQNSVAAGTGLIANDDTGDDRLYLPTWLEAGEYVKFLFGASQTGGAHTTIRLIEIDV